METFGEVQSEKYLRELDAVFVLLSEYPNMGRLYDGATHQLVHGKHIILYRAQSHQIVIGRLFHGAQRPNRD